MMLSNQKGLITVDYLLAFVLVMGFSVVLFSLSMTLTMVEVTQYITYAAARSFSAANISLDHQTTLGTAKYQELVQNSVFQPLFKNGWFEVMAQPHIGNISEQYALAEPTDETHNMYWGAGTTFIARMLDMKIPFYGSTASDDDGTGSGFNTYISSYLGRESTAQECWQFTQNRWNMIKMLDGNYGSVPSSAQPVIIDDNGC